MMDLTLLWVVSYVYDYQSIKDKNRTLYVRLS